LLSTIPVNFNHHMNRGGRLAFRKWLNDYQLSFRDGESNEPVFRYGRPYEDAIDELRSLSAKQQNIFLSNIVGHSAVLTRDVELDHTDGCDIAYPDLEDLIRGPEIRGYLVELELLAKAVYHMKGWTAICGVHSFEDASLDCGFSQAELVAARTNDQYAEDTFIGSLADPDKFATYWLTVSFVVYFLPPSVVINSDEVGRRLEKDRLTNYLVRRGVCFGTMGDCHMDDDIATAYRGTVFDFPEQRLCFIR